MKTHRKLTMENLFNFIVGNSAPVEQIPMRTVIKNLSQKFNIFGSIRKMGCKLILVKLAYHLSEIKNKSVKNHAVPASFFYLTAKMFAIIAKSLLNISLTCAKYAAYHADVFKSPFISNASNCSNVSVQFASAILTPLSSVIVL